LPDFWDTMYIRFDGIRYCIAFDYGV
jgi:hypothetical protein